MNVSARAIKVHFFIRLSWAYNVLSSFCFCSSACTSVQTGISKKKTRSLARALVTLGKPYHLLQHEAHIKPETAMTTTIYVIAPKHVTA